MLKSVWEDASVRSRRAMNAWEELVSSALQSSDHLRIVWWGGANGDSDAAGEAGETGGTQFTCFTGTKVQILTPEAGEAGAYVAVNKRIAVLCFRNPVRHPPIDKRNSAAGGRGQGGGEGAVSKSGQVSAEGWGSGVLQGEDVWVEAEDVVGCAVPAPYAPDRAAKAWVRSGRAVRVAMEQAMSVTASMEVQLALLALLAVLVQPCLLY
jgi:hypothetical protein